MVVGGDIIIMDRAVSLYKRLPNVMTMMTNTVQNRTIIFVINLLPTIETGLLIYYDRHPNPILPP
jgi:hypothetical protein